MIAEMVLCTYQFPQEIERIHNQNFFCVKGCFSRGSRGILVFFVEILGRPKMVKILRILDIF